MQGNCSKGGQLQGAHSERRMQAILNTDCLYNYLESGLGLRIPFQHFLIENEAGDIPRDVIRCSVCRL